MKKVFAIFSLILISLLSFGCDNNLTDIVCEAISEVRYNLFEIKNEQLSVSFTSGFREDPYVIDGTSNAKKEFGVVIVRFLIDISNYSGLPSFILTVNDMDFDGDFELNPFDQTYVQDIETFVLDDSTISIKVLWNSFEFEGNLTNVSKNFAINHKDALKIMIKEFKPQLKKIIKNHTLLGETYIKIISDPSYLLDKKYWYVCIIGRAGENYSVIIDPTTKQILAKNESNNSLILKEK